MKVSESDPEAFRSDEIELTSSSHIQQLSRSHRLTGMCGHVFDDPDFHRTNSRLARAFGIFAHGGFGSHKELLHTKVLRREILEIEDFANQSAIEHAAEFRSSFCVGELAGAHTGTVGGSRSDVANAVNAGSRALEGAMKIRTNLPCLGQTKRE